MRITWGMLLAMTGAFLAFAVTVHGAGALHTIGWIVLFSGLFVLGVGVVGTVMPRRRVVQARVGHRSHARSPNEEGGP